MLAVVTCFFNPSGTASPVANYFRFRQALGPVPLYTVEMSFTGQFVIPDSIRIHGCKETQVLWQKERILNYGISMLPDCFDNVAWLDCDILFLNPDWYSQTDEILKKHAVAQLFQQCHWLDRNGHVEKSRPSSASLGSYFRAGTDQSHPGFAWAARRSLLEHCGGLYDRDITGSGDAWMSHGFFSEFQTPMLMNSSPMMRHEVMRWCQRVKNKHGTEVGVVPGDVLHLYHGSLLNRGYWDRFLDQQKHNFDPATDIKVAKNGAWSWATPKPDLHRAVRNRFESRKEDE